MEKGARKLHTAGNMFMITFLLQFREKLQKHMQNPTVKQNKDYLNGEAILEEH